MDTKLAACIQVRQRDWIHAKVNRAPGVGAIVGSANLSRRALAEMEESGQDEAAVTLRDRPNLNAIEARFQLLWQSDGTRRRRQPVLPGEPAARLVPQEVDVEAMRIGLGGLLRLGGELGGEDAASQGADEHSPIDH